MDLNKPFMRVHMGSDFNLPGRVSFPEEPITNPKYQQYAQHTAMDFTLDFTWIDRLDKFSISSMLGAGYSSVSHGVLSLGYGSRFPHLDAGTLMRFGKYGYASYKLGLGPSFYDFGTSENKPIKGGISFNIMSQFEAGASYCWSYYCLDAGVAYVREDALTGPGFTSDSFMISLGWIFGPLVHDSGKQENSPVDVRSLPSDVTPSQ